MKINTDPASTYDVEVHVQPENTGENLKNKQTLRLQITLINMIFTTPAVQLQEREKKSTIDFMIFTLNFALEIYTNKRILFFDITNFVQELRKK